MPSPAYVFVFADRSVWSGADAGPFGPLVDLILKEGQNLGAYALFLGEKRVQIPKACGAVVELCRDDKNADLGVRELVGEVDEDNQFKPDFTEEASAETFGRTLAGMVLESVIEGENMPDRVTITDLFEVRQIEEIPLQKLWVECQP